uniref:Uncharacterized protein n=2 Tax=Oryza TaxID=4527 RepID=Q10S42_ORYSJ|nr:hypothetical protein LOC_Os03g04330 [Oryza sativa Japonica Group]
MDDDDAARVKLGGGAMMTAEGVGGAAADCHRSAPPISRTATPPDSRLRSPPPTRLHWFAPPGVDPPIRQGWAAGPAMARAAPPPTLLGPSYHHILTTLGTKMSSRITSEQPNRRSHKPHASDASFPLTWIGATPSIRLRGFPLQPSPSRPDADAVTPARR